MKLILFILMFNSMISPSTLDVVRNEFPKINSLEKAEYYLNILEKEDNMEYRAYSAAMLFMKSRYVNFPLTKFKYFKKGKSKLDNLIKENNTNIEMRYIRFLFQCEMPNFLGYNKNIEEDFFVITSGIETSNLNSNFKNKILNNMLLVKNISDDKSAIIKDLLKRI